MRIKYGSVCSGIEAATVAWHSLGWEAAWLSEIDAFPSAVLAHHYPDVPNHGDMTKITPMIRDGSVEAPDVFVGGTPCQAFSVAGLRNSLEDDRGQLSITYIHTLDAIDTVRQSRGEQPCIAVWENVPGVLSTKDNAFGCFLAGLSGEDDALLPPRGKWTNAGCVVGPKRTVAWRVLDAQYFGVAQRRRRVFVVASSREDFSPPKVLFEFEGMRRDSAPSREAGEIPAGTLDAGIGRRRGSGINPNAMAAVTCMAHGQGGAEIAENRSPTLTCNHEAPIVAGALNASMGKGKNGQDAQSLIPVCVTGPITHTLKGEGFDASEDGAGRGNPIIAVHGTQDPCTSTDTAFALGRNNGAENAVAFSHGLQVRRLTPVECERLQGFPDDYTAIPWRKKQAAECPDSPRYKALGNSMAVPVMKWIAERIQIMEDLCKLP